MIGDSVCQAEQPQREAVQTKSCGLLMGDSFQADFKETKAQGSPSQAAPKKT